MSTSEIKAFQSEILAGISYPLPSPKPLHPKFNHAPIRKKILTPSEEKLAVENALRYFDASVHAELAPEFLNELRVYGRIYMYRLRPSYPIHARPIDHYPGKSAAAKAIQLMIQNNLDPQVAQHPEELITYGGNGAVFQNWAQYRLTLQYLATMTDEQTLAMYSGHPMGLFPSHPWSPRVVVTNGTVIPNYSKPDDLERMNALGVSQYGQMTAGSYMYIGPQGIVHGTTLTLLGAGRMALSKTDKTKTSYSTPLEGKLFVSSGLGGMSGAQGKAVKIAGGVGIVAEINPKAVQTRFSQGWVDEVFTDLNLLFKRVKQAVDTKSAVCFAYQGNVVDLWQGLLDQNIQVDVGSDQTSLHNPWSGGYYPQGLSLEESQSLMAQAPEEFKQKVQGTLRNHAALITEHSKKGMYFFDYGNAFLLESSRAGAPIVDQNGDFLYKSYIQDILGPQCFDLGFGPFRWICTSGKADDLERSDHIAADFLREYLKTAPSQITSQLEDNLRWIETAGANKMVVGSQARILYADSHARIEISRRLNQAIAAGEISAPIVLGRDHHDVSGTDSPYRETSNIYDGSRFTADMAVHNFVGDGFRGASWISLHNGGGVGWGEVINGGFGLVLDGSKTSEEKLQSMLFWDVNNGIARRAWARNPNAKYAIEQAMRSEPRLKVTASNTVDPTILHSLN